MAYQPIENYGLIGNMHTAALVERDGSIDDRRDMPPAGPGELLSNGMVHRYNTDQFDDGLPAGEGTVNMCTFWLVEALTRAGRTDPNRLAQARLLSDQMLGHASPLGLFAEQSGARGEALGNSPQALTHLSLISAAFNLDRTLGG